MTDEKITEIDVLGLPCSGLATLLAGIALRTGATATGCIEELRNHLNSKKLVANEGKLPGETIAVTSDDKVFCFRVLGGPQKPLKVLNEAAQTYNSDRFLLIVVNPFAIQALPDGKKATEALVAQTNEKWNSRAAVLSTIEACLGLKANGIKIPDQLDFEDRVSAAESLLSHNSQATIGNDLWDAVLGVLETVPNVGLVLNFHDIRSRTAVNANQAKEKLDHAFNRRDSAWPNVFVESGLSVVVGLRSNSVQLLATSKDDAIKNPDRWASDFTKDWVEAKLLPQLNTALEKIKRTPPLPWYRKVGAVLLWPFALPILTAMMGSVILWVLSAIGFVFSSVENDSDLFFDKLFPYASAIGVSVWLIGLPALGSLLFLVTSNRILSNKSEFEEQEAKANLFRVGWLSDRTRMYALEGPKRLVLPKSLAPNTSESRPWSLKIFAEYSLGCILMAIAILAAFLYCWIFIFQFI